MRPTLRQLQYIVAVADSGRFSDAAQKLHVSQPSLSAQVAEAEAHLGAPVFERSRAGVLVTPAGDEVVRRARYILRQVEDMKAAVQHGRDGLYGRIKLGVLPTIGPYLLPRCTHDLHERFPDLRLGIRDESTVNLAKHLADGQLDTVISTREDHPGCSYESLFTERLWVAVPPEDVLSERAGPVTHQELEGRPFLTLGLGHRLTLLVQGLAQRAEAYVSTDYEGTSLDAVRHMAALGAGVAILPDLYVRCEAMRDANLHFRPIDDDGANREIALVWRENSPLEESFRALASVLRSAADAILSIPSKRLGEVDPLVAQSS
ncbi:MAG: LysR family transcriptional regulator [Alphaproteobacteria bacterium]|nr:LysR family transcriptional regulator [Alphaproteobacteria bacterium]